MYNLFVRERALEESVENEMILTGEGRKNKMFQLLWDVAMCEIFND